MGLQPGIVENVGRPLVGLQTGIVENVGRPSVGVQGSIIKNHHFRPGDPQGASLHHIRSRSCFNYIVIFVNFVQSI